MIKPSVFEAFDKVIAPECGFDPLSLQPVSDLEAAFTETRNSRCADCHLLQEAGSRALEATFSYYTAYHEALHELDKDDGNNPNSPSFDDATVIYRVGLVQDEEGRRLSVDPVTPEEAMQQIKESQGEKLDQSYEEAAMIVGYFNIMRSGCSGTLKLRKIQDGVEYNFTSCRSPSVIDASKGRSYPAAVTATHIQST